MGDLEQAVPQAPPTPADLYAELFEAVQASDLFADSKSFVDCLPRQAPEAILRAYRAARDASGFDLGRFVSEHFAPEPGDGREYRADPDRALASHIDELWQVLSRAPRETTPGSSILPIPHGYVVPGGRFSEMYYWDSYFTMLGLAAAGKMRAVRDMVDNFAWLIDRYGHIPNGNRTYYLSRSQPPLFALMVRLAERHRIAEGGRYLPQLLAEHRYWMAGADGLSPGAAFAHVVRMPDGSLLNRYWDARDTPREEAWSEDMASVRAASGRPAGAVFRDLRAAAASGWDFSSRWLADPHDLSSICTTDILPVDLNAFLLTLERQIARLAPLGGDEATGAAFRAAADARRRAMDRYFWVAAEGCFVDYDWRRDTRRPHVNAGVAAALYVGLASHGQAHRVAEVLRTRLTLPGGLATTELVCDHQWDRDNGWAPLHWMAIHGLRRYGLYDQARDLTDRWLRSVGALYTREAKLVEKYAIGGGQASGGGGGEYPLQDGFGWTNGVTRALLTENPGHRAHGARAGRRG